MNPAPSRSGTLKHRGSTNRTEQRLLEFDHTPKRSAMLFSAVQTMDQKLLSGSVALQLNIDVTASGLRAVAPEGIHAGSRSIITLYGFWAWKDLNRPEADVTVDREEIEISVFLTIPY